MTITDAEREVIARKEIERRLKGYDVLLQTLQRISAINGSTGGDKALVAEFKHIANTALGAVSYPNPL